MLFSGIAFGISYLFNFFLAPYITKHMGADGYGFITLARNFTNYAAILTTALNSYAARFISVEYHKGNKNKANIYYSTVFYANLILVSAIMLVTVIGVIFLDKLLNIPPELTQDTKKLFLMVFFAFSITSVGTAYTASAYIKNRLDLTSVFKGVSYICEALTIILLYLILGPTLWFVGVGLTVAAIEIFITNYTLTKRLTPDLQTKTNLFSKKAVKTLIVKGIWNSINSLGNTLNSGLDLIVCNLMLTPLAMGQLSYAKTIGIMFSTLYVLVAQPFQPIFLKIYSTGDNESLVKELKYSMKVAGFLSGLAFAGFIALGKFYFRLWIPSQDTELIYILTIITIGSSLGEGVVCPLYYIYTLTVKNKVPCFVTIAGGIANVLGMYFLIKYTYMGVIAVVVTTFVIMSVINMIFNPLYSAKCLKIPLETFFPNIFRHLISCGIMTGVFISLAKIMPQHGWLSLIVAAVLDCVIGFIIQLIVVFDKSERIKLVKIIQKKYA